MARPLGATVRCLWELDSSSTAADEVHDDGDDRKDEQQMNEEAADMQDEKSAEPQHDQHNSQYEKHERPSFVRTGCRAEREYLHEIRGELWEIRCLALDNRTFR